jgi:hypothetical protein
MKMYGGEWGVDVQIHIFLIMALVGGARDDGNCFKDVITIDEIWVYR